MKKENLPNKWKIKDFEECIEKTPSSSKLKIPKKNYKNVGKYAIVDQGSDFIAGYTDDSNKVYKGDLPIVIFGDHTRNFKYVDFPFALGADGTRILVPRKKFLNPKYFYFFLKRLVIENHGYSRHYKFLKEKQIIIPPIETQKKIISNLEKSERLKEWRTEANCLTDEFLKSVFLEMFGDPVINPNNWEILKFNKVGTLQRGKSKHRPRNAPELLGGPYPLIQTGDVANSKGYIKKYQQTYSELGFKQSKMWSIGTLCITIAANIAKTGILTFEACFPDSIVGFSPNSKVRTEYVQYWLSFLQKILESSAPESAQKNINLKILSDLNIPIPPIDLQDNFVEVVNKIEKVREYQEKSKDEIDNLFNALAQKAFKGELKC